MFKLKQITLTVLAALCLTNLPVTGKDDNAIQQDGLPPSMGLPETHSIWDAPPGCYFAKDKSGNALWMFYIPGPPYNASSQPCVVFPKELEQMIGTKDYLDLLYGPTTEEVVKQPAPKQQPSKMQRLKQHLSAWAQSLTPVPGSYSTFSGFVYPTQMPMVTPGVATPMQQPQFMQGTINY